MTLVALLAMAWAPADGFAAPASKCEFGLVLSGGGARGIAHLGVLEVFQEHGIVPDCIVGASMGAVVGALYASGHDLGEIQAILSTLSWRTLFAEPENRTAQPIVHRLESQRTAVRLGVGGHGLRLPSAMLNDSRVNRLLIENLAPANFRAGRDFSRLPIPFRTLGTDLNTGDRVVLDHGDLARAVRASMSVPLAYAPVRWNDALLIDGGMVDNIPVSLAEDMGATFTVAVDVSTPLDTKVQADLYGVTKRIIDLLFLAKNRIYQRDPDVIIRPDLREHSFADYSRMDELIEAGRQAARAALEKIPQRFWSRKSPPPGDHSLGSTAQSITQVSVEGLNYLQAETLVREFGVRPGSPFRLQEVLDGLDRIYSTGLVKDAWIDLLPDGEHGVHVVLMVTEESRQTADVGLAYQNDDQVQGFARFEVRNLLGAGERLRIVGFASAHDVFGFFGVRSIQFLGNKVGFNVGFEIHDEKPKVFTGKGSFINRTEFRRRHVRASLDVPFGTHHLLEAGIRIGTVKIVERLGIPYPRDKQDHVVLVGRYVWDDLDSLLLPRHGRFVRVLVEHNLEPLGATTPYTLVDVLAHGARAAGPLTLEGRFRFGYSDGQLPVYEQFRIGGPDLVPGLDREERWGKQALAASLTVGMDPMSVLRVYGRVGLGNTWERVRDIRFADAIWGGGIGATVATPIGPFQVLYGWSEGSRNALYLSLGWQSRDPRDVTR